MTAITDQQNELLAVMDSLNMTGASVSDNDPNPTVESLALRVGVIETQMRYIESHYGVIYERS